MEPQLFRKQAACLDSRNDDEIVCCVINKGFRYTSFSNEFQYAEYVLRTPYCNEMVFKDCYSYFDIDCEQNLEQLGTSIEALVTEFTQFLTEKFKQLLGVAILPKHFMWSQCCRDNKTSLHLVIRDPDHYWPEETRQNEMKCFMKQLVADTLDSDTLSYFSLSDDSYVKKSLLDLAVYSRNRLMRTVFCKKDDSPVLLPLRGNRTAKTVVKHLITVADIEDKEPYSYKAILRKQVNAEVDSELLCLLADKFGAKVHEVRGSLICLRNRDAVRKCPINGEENLSDTCFFVKRENSLWFGCHNLECQGRLIKAHTFDSTEFQHYESYKEVLRIHKENPDEFDTDVITRYCKQTIKFIDHPESPFFITTAAKPLDNFVPEVISKEVFCTKTLFFRYADIELQCANETVKFSDTLKSLVKKRELETYSSICWTPFTKRSIYTPIVRSNCFNTFSGFVLDNKELSKGLDFQASVLYILLYKLAGSDSCFEFLLNWIAYKLQRVHEKVVPLCLVFCNTCPGTGKSSFGKFLSQLFSCSKRTCISYANVKQFTSVFTSELEHALIVILEELGQNEVPSGFLKQRISQDEFQLEKKGVDRRTVPFRGSIVIFSNDLRVVKVSRQDRRYVCFESQKDQVGNTAFFNEVYTSLRDIAVMRSAFEFFMERDISEWDYKLIPQTNLRAKLQRCSDKLDHRFCRYLFTECLPDVSELHESELYSFWLDFCSTKGCKTKREFSHVMAGFDLTMEVSADNGVYNLDHEHCERKLNEIFNGDKIKLHDGSIFAFRSSTD